jgi:hypothetical protein
MIIYIELSFIYTILTFKDFNKIFAGKIAYKYTNFVEIKTKVAP